MARIEGVNLPKNKRLVIALTYIFGIGPSIAKNICKVAKIDESKRIHALTDDEIILIRETIKGESVETEGDLRRKVAMNIKRLMDLGCWRGLRHRYRLPVRGQRTHTNARTRKGKKRVAVAGKKKA